jgi:hypothetical protein
VWRLVVVRDFEVMNAKYGSRLKEAIQS